ncbi:hypothetical protein RchiOBHm_Chr5g0002951 [Rosa chinensis]|uniref:Uncharacterized protein n=1 Tax=Rosa chinensis TaxID=74649 RepID=A0A2P6Q2L1_ROSCH|nr:hypothetical protein RchiOBHm_Chr5g0002951 [Rosa chinensis]
MKQTLGNGYGGSTSSPAKRPHERCHKYLKPGTLAQLRDSKITARRSKEREFGDLKTQISLYQLLLSSISSSSSQAGDNILDQSHEDIPCFPPATLLNRPPCLQRKKLVADAPVSVFSDN